MNYSQYNKDNIDNDAEREGIALLKAGRLKSSATNRIRKRKEYNQEQFNKLFKS